MEFACSRVGQRPLFFLSQKRHAQNLPARSPRTNQLLPVLQKRKTNGKAIPSHTQQPWIRRQLQKTPRHQKTMNPANIKKLKAELEHATAVVEIRLDFAFEIAIQSQLIYIQQRSKNREIAETALKIGLAAQSMFQENPEIYKMIAGGWQLTETEIQKIVEIANQ